MSFSVLFNVTLLKWGEDMNQNGPLVLILVLHVDIFLTKYAASSKSHEHEHSLIHSSDCYLLIHTWGRSDIFSNLFHQAGREKVFSISALPDAHIYESSSFMHNV